MYKREKKLLDEGHEGKKNICKTKCMWLPAWNNDVKI